MASNSNELPRLDLEVAIDELRGHSFLVEERKAHANFPEGLAGLMQLPPAQMAAHPRVQRPRIVYPRKRRVLREERLRLGWADHRHDDEMLPAANLSIGVALYPGHGGTANQLIHAADAALYKAKESGRNQVVLSGT